MVSGFVLYEQTHIWRFAAKTECRSRGRQRKTGRDYEAFQLNEEINELREEIAVAKSKLEKIESKDESDEELTNENNLYKAELEYKDYEEKIAAATKMKEALYKKDTVETLLMNIRKKATAELKKEIVRKTNEKLQEVIADDFIEVESIDRYIKLKGKDAASEGRTGKNDAALFKR